MDDYRDLVTAAFALLCAALMLVAGLLLLGEKPEQGRADPRLEVPARAVAPSYEISAGGARPSIATTSLPAGSHPSRAASARVENGPGRSCRAL